MAWDRYAGLGNNPVRYTDPTGHDPCDSIPDDAGKAACKGSSNSSSSVPPTPIQPIKLKGWDPYYGEKQPDDTSCAVSSMAAALSVLLKGKVSAKDLDRIVEKSGLGWPGFLTKFGIPAYRQDDVLNMIADWGWASFTAEYHDGGTRNDLIDNLNKGYPTIVSVSWGGIGDGVGHAVLLTGYDPSTKEFTFFDPGKGYEVTEVDISSTKSFDDVWLNQENIFIPSGSYVTIIPKP